VTEKFDAKRAAASISRLMQMAETAISKPGAGIVTQRLIDCCSTEFGKLMPAQRVEVLSEIDKHYDRNLLRDGNGSVIGYAYSRKIFVSLVPSQMRSEMLTVSNRSATPAVLTTNGTPKAKRGPKTKK
jgi:hypothetical protein